MGHMIALWWFKCDIIGLTNSENDNTAMQIWLFRKS